MSSGKTVVPGLCGVLNLNKPTGLTSRAVVDRVVKVARHVKVGHAGTLDPLATGVLVVAVGAATRLVEYVQRLPKTYRTRIRLGARSETGDADGPIVAVDEATFDRPDAQAVARAVAMQVGTLSQKPPEFSALKIGGKRAYDLARAGVPVDLAPRAVTVSSIEVLEYSWPWLSLEVHCGGGTYIRSIARDIGETLGCGGLVAVLERTAIGPFTIAEALDPEVLTAEALPGRIQPALAMLPGLPIVRLSASEVPDVGQGKDVRHDAPPGEVAMVGPEGILIAVGLSNPTTGRISPKRVLTATRSTGGGTPMNLGNVRRVGTDGAGQADR